MAWHRPRVRLNCSRQSVLFGLYLSAGGGGDGGAAAATPSLCNLFPFPKPFRYAQLCARL